MIEAAPFIGKISENPALALRLLRALAGMEGLPATFSLIVEGASLLAHDVGPAVRMLDRLCEAGAAEKRTDGWCLRTGREELERLSCLIEGALAAQACHRDRDTVGLVITYPGAESSFMEQLRAAGPFYARVPHTAESFMHLAAQARERLLVMSPFLDETGVELIVRMFDTLPAGAERVLIVRNADQLARTRLGPSLPQRGVKVLSYSVPRGEGWFETFHSKVIIADGAHAYIGSANFLSSSLSRALELGVLVSGESVLLLESFLNAIVVRLREGEYCAQPDQFGLAGGCSGR